MKPSSNPSSCRVPAQWQYGHEAKGYEVKAPPGTVDKILRRFCASLGIRFTLCRQSDHPADAALER